MRAKNKLVVGVGINDIDELTYTSGKCCRAYQTWRNMLLRCYDARVQAKQPAYVGCVVDPRWHRFSVFRAWYDARYRPGSEMAQVFGVPRLVRRTVSSWIRTRQRHPCARQQNLRT